MNNRYVIRFAGSGGQGVVLASVFLAQAAVLNGSKVVQSQTYGPETRGGMCQAYTIISNEEIWFTKPEKSDVLIALTQAALNKFSKDTVSVIIADKGLNISESCPVSRVYYLPILETAAKIVGQLMTANVVAAAIVNSLFNLFPEEIMLEAIRMHIPSGTEELDIKAFEEGKKLAEKAKSVIPDDI
ncbi:MAG: 2-oxoacid:acceptor oxidoreductase family protein [Anaerolineaceae bacterium]|nr:2-oxoacid:acceptor oxidoreductase family protein [Anaerolineaceae bacterium]